MVGSRAGESAPREAGSSDGRVTLWGIEVFRAIAEEGAIQGAARRLGVSASAVSQQLTSLEAALATTLIERAARPLRLSAAGSIFLRHARIMLEAAEEARAEIARADLSALPALRLGMIEDLEADVTPALLASLPEELALARFTLETGPSHHLLAQLEARTLDLVVTADLGAEARAAREVHGLIREPFVAVLPPGHAPRPLGPGAAMDGLPLIQYATRHLMGGQIAAHLIAHGHVPGARYELDSYHAILAMVAAGHGWAILTPLALHRARRFHGAVEVAPLPLPAFSRNLVISARPGALGAIPARVAERLRHLLEHEVINPALGHWPWLEGELALL